MMTITVDILIWESKQRIQANKTILIFYYVKSSCKLYCFHQVKNENGTEYYVDIWMLNKSKIIILPTPSQMYKLYNNQNTTCLPWTRCPTILIIDRDAHFININLVLNLWYNKRKRQLVMIAFMITNMLTFSVTFIAIEL